MDKSPSVSVVIPVYNVENYLGECIESVIRQTYSDIEIILIDDGSTDSSGDICDRYEQIDKRIKVVHKNNGGLSSARNDGIKISSGHYLYFLDSDDYIHPSTIEMLITVANKENADVVYFEADSFTDSGDEIKQTYHRQNEYPAMSGLDTFIALTKNKEFRSSVPLLFISKTLLYENDIYFAENLLHEDMLFTFQVFCLSVKAAHCHKSLYFRRYRSNSIMTSVPTSNNLYSQIEIFNRILIFSEKQELTTLAPVIQYLSRNGLNVYNIYEKLDRTEGNKCVEVIKKFGSNIRKNKKVISADLYRRSYGKPVWIIGKIFNKFFRIKKS